ncbi:High-affinity choline transporter 1 [Liparis tanakae]|uniref:High-affinity choline transporter 1 n=1 Tax=Liparis tanakae TaxID=230148 RepID=A0A4Z2E5K8_9TELE|nr:High-affinity choline transporter 1 [Liparis tanakae]
MTVIAIGTKVNKPLCNKNPVEKKREVFFCCHDTMALNVPGVIAVSVFYVIILGTGLWAARKSRKAEKNSRGNATEVVLLGDRNINLLVGVFTMTGTFFILLARRVCSNKYKYVGCYKLTPMCTYATVQN